MILLVYSKQTFARASTPPDRSRSHSARRSASQTTVSCSRASKGLCVRALCAVVLGASTTGNQTPHVTLAHPRNPRAPENELWAAASLPIRLAITFTSVYWIEQDEGAPWRVRYTYVLHGTSSMTRKRLLR
jgi:hypothetical protein